MDAIQFLTTQHRQVEHLFEDLERVQDPAQKREIFAEIADALAIHASVEEQIFYPESKEARADELLREAVEEHLSVKRIIADLLELDAGEPSFDAKCKVLADQVQHHVGKEERELFPAVRKAFDQDRLEELGEEMEAVAAELLEADEPRMQVPNEIDAPAPLE
jgi:hemerythrin superfamily protein